MLTSKGEPERVAGRLCPMGRWADLPATAGFRGALGADGVLLWPPTGSIVSWAATMFLLSAATASTAVNTVWWVRPTSVSLITESLAHFLVSSGGSDASARAVPIDLALSGRCLCLRDLRGPQ